MSQEFKLPDLGEGIESGEVVNVLVAEGDEIEADSNVLELETDKAIVELPCPHAGRVLKVHVSAGSRVQVGEAILTLETSEGAEGEGDGESNSDQEASSARGKAARGKDEKSGKKDRDSKRGEDAKEGKAEAESDAEDEEADGEGGRAAGKKGEGGRAAGKKAEKKSAEKDRAKAGRKAAREEPRDEDEDRDDDEQESEDARSERGESEEEDDSRGTQRGKNREGAAKEGRSAAKSGREGAPAPAGPATRRLARELGVDLRRLEGSGPTGRITVDDVKEFVRDLAGRSSGDALGGGASAADAATSAAAPRLPDLARWGEVETEPFKGVRRATAEATTLAWRTIPHVTQFDSADVTELESARRAHSRAQREKKDPGAKITFTVLAVKACVAALERFPQFNASLDAQGGEIIRKKYIHIGVAVDTEHGLMVPVVRDADRKSIEELALEIEDLAARARERKLERDEMRGGCFTITNLGGIGGTSFTPIVNWPEVAILGLSRTREEVVWRDGAAVPRLVLPLCLSYDHRVIDGADGARFTRHVAELLEEPFRLLIAL